MVENIIIMLFGAIVIIAILLAAEVAAKFFDWE